jgi:hypothetical protein
MGYQSMDDMVKKLCLGKADRVEFCINTGGIGTVVAGRWYDLSQFPVENSWPQYTHGNYIYNYHFHGPNGWTYGTPWDFASGHTRMVRTPGAGNPDLSQNTPCQSGISYSVSYVLTRSAGDITVSLGGTSGANRTASATYRENIVCPTSGGVLKLTAGATFAGTVDAVSVTRDLAFTPYSMPTSGFTRGCEAGRDIADCSSGETRHILTFGAHTDVAAGAPAILYLVDILGVYPRIATNSALVQTLDNTETLPRYTDGKGVMAFYVINTANGANAQTFSMWYNNQDNTSGQTFSGGVSNTATAIVGHMSHTGTAAGNYGPFLPLQPGDYGIRAVQQVKFSAASAAAGLIDLVLCKPICSIPLTAAFYMSERDLMNAIPALPRIYDGAVLGLIIQCSAVMTACNYMGFYDVGWG